ncbi:unnamed protein product, partial [Effrenium voratum]
QQHALVSAAGLEDSDSETEEERGQLAAAAALANAVAEESSSAPQLLPGVAALQLRPHLEADLAGAMLWKTYLNKRQ